MGENNVNWKKVIVFYIIACAISWPLFALRDLYPEYWESLNIPNGIKNLGYMWGPGIAAILCFIFFRKAHLRTISFFGTSAFKSLAFFLIPFIVFFLITLINPGEKLRPEFFLKLIPFGFLMTLGEELGWRGFLQDSLSALTEWKKWLTLGLMWEFWHFTRGLTDGDLSQILIRKTFLIISVMILTLIIGKLTERTKSLFVAITLHAWVNIQMEFSHFNTYLAGGISLIIWTLLIWKWNRLPESRRISYNQ